MTLADSFLNGVARDARVAFLNLCYRVHKVTVVCVVVACKFFRVKVCCAFVLAVLTSFKPNLVCVSSVRAIVHSRSLSLKEFSCY